MLWNGLPFFTDGLACMCMCACAQVCHCAAAMRRTSPVMSRTSIVSSFGPDAAAGMRENTVLHIQPERLI